jgi:hypothetical protein
VPDVAEETWEAITAWNETSKVLFQRENKLVLLRRNDLGHAYPLSSASRSPNVRRPLDSFPRVDGHGTSRGHASSNNGTTATCDCGRRIRTSRATYHAGPILCGLCGSRFSVELIHSPRQRSAETATAIS